MKQIKQILITLFCCIIKSCGCISKNVNNLCFIRVESSTTLQDAYRPYSGKNYVPTAAARVPTSGGQASTVKTTKAIHIPGRPKTQMGLSTDKIEVHLFE